MLSSGNGPVARGNAWATLGRILAVGALLLVAAAYTYGVWMAAAYAWGKGLRFYASPLVTANAVRSAVHCFLLGIAVFILPRFAGVGLPDVRKGGWALYGYGVVIAVAVAATAANYVRPSFTSPFAGRGPLFFTLGPLAWELMWPGFMYGFSRAILGPRLSAVAGPALVVVLALAGTAWFVPVIRWLSPLDTVAFVALTFVVSFLSLTLRRRTGSIWPGLAGHVVVKFLLTW
jgi:hypothetical protein